jgi:adenylate cyclase
MVSATTRELMGNAFPVRELSRIAVVGRKEPVVVFEPMTAAQYDARRQVLAVFDKGLRLFYEGRFPEAISAFEGIVADDPPAAAYVVKCRAEAEKPHAGPWTGVWTMTEK